MSGFSTYAARVRHPATFTVADAPIDTVLARDHAINNVNHYADIMGQVRANWNARPGAYIESDNSNSKTWRTMWHCPTFPIALRPDGSSYRVRVRIAGAGESAAEVRFAVSLGSAHSSAFSVYPGTATTDAVWSTGAITSTTHAYRTGASLGTEAWTTMVALSATEASACVRVTSTVLDTNAVPIGVTHALVQAIVWGYDDDVAHHARLSAVTLEEWPG